LKVLFINTYFKSGVVNKIKLIKLAYTSSSKKSHNTVARNIY